MNGPARAGGPTSPNRPSRIIGLLLAAGGGSRYGKPKVLAHDGLWLKYAIQALEDGGCGDVIVVLGAARVELPNRSEHLIAVHNPDWESGMASSMRVGLREAERLAGGDPTAVVMLHFVDMPDITGAVVGRVRRAAADTGLARASYDGAPGHPIAAAQPHWGPMAAAAEGDGGGRTYFRGRTDVVLVPCEDLATGADHDVPAEGSPM